MNTRENIETGLSPAPQALSNLRDKHVRDEFAMKDANGVLDTMMPDAYMNHAPDGAFERKFCGVLVALVCGITSIVIVLALK
jgi:hypothetical protein